MSQSAADRKAKLVEERNRSQKEFTEQQEQHQQELSSLRAFYQEKSASTSSTKVAYSWIRVRLDISVVASAAF